VEESDGRRRERSQQHHPDLWARIEAVLSGSVSLTELTPDERLAVNVELDATIADRLAEIDWKHGLQARGFPVVAMDEQGHLVKHLPDGSTSLIDPDSGRPRPR
jgi:hypothetical protein